jgi:hypothetical protein
MNNQINEMSKGEKSSSSPNKYNLKSKKKEGQSNTPDQPLIAERPAKPVAITAKERKTQNLSSIAKDPVPEVREILKPPSSFNFEHEMQKSEFMSPFQS